MGLIANDKKVYDLLNDKLYLIHSNQRKYVWTQNNWNEMYEDIKLVYEEKSSDHFIGSIVLKKEPSRAGIKHQFSVIDGQQRILTITILYCAIGLLFINNKNREYFEGLSKQLFVLDSKNVKHTIVSQNANIHISKLVQELFILGEKQLDEGKQLDIEILTNKVKLIKTIKNCLIFFYDKLTELVNNDMNALQNFKDVVDDIRYIDIVAEDDEDAFSIFEILNARGQPLTDFELFRNFALKYSNNDNKTRIKECLQSIEQLLNKDLEIFLKHYVLHKYGLKTDKNEKRPFKVISSKEKGNDILELVEDILLKSAYYSKITTFKNCTDLEYKIFSFFKPRRQQQFRPLVMGLMHQLELKNIDEKTYNQNIEFLYEFFICYHIIGEQTSNKIEDIVYTYSDKFENSMSTKTLNDFKSSMIARLPKKDNFIQSVKRIAFSNHIKAYSGSRKSENVKAIFEVIERENGFTGDFTDFNIEHCNPDSDGIEINTQIGNLLLIEKSINDKCKNKQLNDKIVFYKKSILFEPHTIVLKYNRGETLNVKDRTERLAQRLYDIVTRINKD